MASWSYILVDNGSRRPAAWARLVHVARALGEKAKTPVEPVSMLHSDRLAATVPGMPPARTMRPYLERRLAEGERRFGVVPLFLGPSGAVTSYLTRLVEELKVDSPELRVEVAPFLFDAQEPNAPLVGLVEDNVRQTMARHGLRRPVVVVVDHGSPNPQVTEVRNQVAAHLRKRLAGEVEAVVPASMERRPGAEFDFNEPLLATALASPEVAGREVVLAMLFVSPGRHAGRGGDIDEILEEARRKDLELVVHRTPLLGEHPGLIDLLHRRLASLPS